MKVYVLETGCYEDRSIHGVFSTPELAMAAWQPGPAVPVPTWPPRVIGRRAILKDGEFTEEDIIEPGRHIIEPGWHSYTWARVGTGWTFDADWNDAAEIYEYEMDEARA